MKIDFLDQCEAYSANEMSEEERHKFELKLQQPELKKKYDLFSKSLDYLIELSLKEEVQSIHRRKSKRRSILLASSAIAACIAGIAIIFTLQLEWNSTSNLVSENFELYPDISTRRSVQAAKLVSFYSNGEHQLFLNGIDADALGNDTLLLYYLNSILEMQISDLPLSIPPEQIDDSEINEQLRWYYALCQIQIGKINRGISELRKIDIGQFNYSRAQVLLDKLEN